MTAQSKFSTLYEKGLFIGNGSIGPCAPQFHQSCPQLSDTKYYANVVHDEKTYTFESRTIKRVNNEQRRHCVTRCPV